DGDPLGREYRLSEACCLKLKALWPRISSPVSSREKSTKNLIEASVQASMIGGAWKMLNPSYGNTHAVYVKFTRWAHNGMWAKTIQALDGLPEASLLASLVENYEDGYNQRQRVQKYKDYLLNREPENPPA
ncbi:MAG: hypothetical protein ABI858_10475, partial [Pseudoxanthomonas sp.]